MKSLEKIPQLVKDGNMSLDQAAVQIMEHIYKNRSWFGLKKMKDDNLHDFLLFYYERSKQIFDLYKPELGSFTSFLYGNINNALLAWSKLIQKKAYDEHGLELLSDVVYEESVCTYSQMEPPEVCQSANGDAPPIQKVIELTKQEERRYSFDRGRKFRIAEMHDLKKKELRKEACLVLLLKSCSFATDSLIEKTAAVCERSVKDIKKLVEKARNSMKAKNIRISKLEKARDNFFYFKRKYFAELESSDVNTEFCRIIGNKIVKADQAWKDKNRQLKSETLRVPSNVTIGKLLGMSDRHVRYIINQASKNMDNISLKSYYGQYENIFGKRKFKQETRDGGTFS